MASSYWINRTLCDVLAEMRKCYETHNYAPLMGLIEEAQSMGNRMEAALSDQKDIVKMQAEWHSLRKEIKDLRNLKVELVGHPEDDRGGEL